MPTKTIDVSKSQASIEELLTLTNDGIEVIITDNDKPVARLSPMKRKLISRVAGLHSGAIWTRDDFDEPLNDEFWVGNS